MANSGSGLYSTDMWVFPRAERVTEDLISKTSARSGLFTTAVTIAALLLVLGVVGFIARASLDGFGDYGNPLWCVNSGVAPASRRAT